MATEVEIFDPKYYDNGVPGAGNSVGWRDGHFRVFGCCFKTPSNGANHIRFRFGYHYPAVSTTIPLLFSIGKSVDSHPADGRNSAYNGEAKITPSQNSQYPDTVIAEGECDVLLLPNTTYYLWIFPGPDTNSYYGWYRTLDEIFVDGSAGIVRIKEGDRELLAVPMVKEGGELIQLAATVKSGENLNYCV